MAGDVILVFLVTALISFAGSLQPGPVNMAVMHTAITGNFRRALITALGGVMPELIYSSIALWFSVYFLSSSWISNTLNAISILFFAIAGIYLILKKQSIKQTAPLPSKNNFLFGLLSALFNPMIFAFWLMILTMFRATTGFYMNNLVSQMAFILGTAAGAFVLLWLVALYAHRKKTAIYKLLPAHPSKITGIVFIILAFWQAFKWIV